jgi:ribosome maturation factor RimP
LAELEEIAAAQGCELAYTELAGNILRLTLDRPDQAEGVSLADCQAVSRQASALLDVVDAIPGRYILEVSSPGLDRKLVRPRDYERFVGRRARVTFRNALGRKQTVTGRLERFELADPEGESRVVVALGDEGPYQVLVLKDVQLARLEIEL